jgi:hypothetical protein
MKRKPNTHMGTAPSKKTKRAAESAASTAPGTDHPVLRRLYPQVLTLRHYLLSQLPKASKNRRRRLSQLGATPVQHDASAHDVDIQLGQLLDSALIGCFPATEPKNAAQEVKERNRDIENFTQQFRRHLQVRLFSAKRGRSSDTHQGFSALHVAMLSDLEAE